jgi:hypothetical protein
VDDAVARCDADHSFDALVVAAELSLRREALQLDAFGTRQEHTSSWRAHEAIGGSLKEARPERLLEGGDTTRDRGGVHAQETRGPLVAAASTHSEEDT